MKARKRVRRREQRVPRDLLFDRYGEDPEDVHARTVRAAGFVLRELRSDTLIDDIVSGNSMLLH